MLTLVSIESLKTVTLVTVYGLHTFSMKTRVFCTGSWT